MQKLSVCFAFHLFALAIRGHGIAFTSFAESDICVAGDQLESDAVPPLPAPGASLVQVKTNRARSNGDPGSADWGTTAASLAQLLTTENASGEKGKVPAIASSNSAKPTTRIEAAVTTPTAGIESAAVAGLPPRQNSTFSKFAATSLDLLVDFERLTGSECAIPILAVLVVLVTCIVLVVALHCCAVTDEEIPVPPFSGRGRQLLCPELVVPEGFECSFTMPQLIARDSDGGTNDTFFVGDKVGNSLLNVRLEREPPDQGEHTDTRSGPQHVVERVELVTPNGQLLAVCKIWVPQWPASSADQMAEDSREQRLRTKPSALIYNSNGELFAQLGECSAMGVGPAALAPNALDKDKPRDDQDPHYGLWAAKTRFWHLYFYGSLGARRLNITDRWLNLVASVEPRANPRLGSTEDSPEHSSNVDERSYVLRVAAQNDAGLILCSLFVLDRIVAAEAAVASEQPHTDAVGSTGSDGDAHTVDPEVVGPEPEVV
eukprot:gnl/TRDRNA2_/TRDRNA2_185462_c0_seq1.p1 gnl/TRDRNA2_/TRDRNA2_185462_c0~~gnl/TRDRNA2_/TRDRNA2_185462_c0_seq1.p1  ORF type:complete len:489 (+),score=68.05 gnl/TRDRNA2_/TRDRNA2_185462_c0_seq1:115-1581(+)